MQGEQQQKLDVVANELFANAMKGQGEVAGVASEEDEHYVVFETERAKAGQITS